MIILHPASESHFQPIFGVRPPLPGSSVSQMSNAAVEFPAAITRALSSFAILDVSPSGVIGIATEKAALLLAKFFPVWTPEPIQRLPSPLLNWLKSTCHGGDQASSALWTLKSGSEQLIVRVTGTQDGYFQLALEERSDATVAKRLEELGLTPREAEVLVWISRGKTNSEIATILGCTLRTVTKHTEHIRSKLRVETRTAAAAIALELTGGY